jgi:predicted porin
MKKQLIAAAVATAIAAPMAASADVTVYGKLHYSITNLDLDSAAGVPADTDWDDAAVDGTHVMSHDSFFGIKGSEDLGNGLSAVFQMEFSISADDLGAVNNDHNTYVALAGSWGVAGIGQVDTPLNSSTASLELFDQQMGDNDQLGFNNIRLPNAVFYMSPNWNGLSVVAGIGLPAADADADGVEAVSIAAMYSNGPWYASLAYESVTGEYADAILAAAVTDGMDFDKWRLGLGYTANGFHVGFIYEDREIDDLDTIGFSDNDSDSWQLSGSYTAGNNTFKIAYGQVDEWGMTGTNTPYAVDDAEQWTVGIDHKLSNRTKVYAVYSDYSDDVANEDWDALSLGIIHTF